MTAVLHVVLAVAAASDAVTITTSYAYPEYHLRHRPMALFSNGVFPKQLRQPLADSWVRRRKYLIRPCPGWHPCAEIRGDSSISDSDISTIESDDGGTGTRSSSSSSSTDVADDFANIIVDDDERIIATNSSSFSPSRLSLSSTAIDGKNIIDGDENYDTIAPTRNSANETNNDVEQRREKTQKQQLGAILILLTVPAAWGTYAPAVKYIYDVAPDGTQPSMPGLVFSAGYYCVAALTLGILSFWKDQQTEDDDVMEDGSQRTRTVQEVRVEEKEMKVGNRVGKVQQQRQSKDEVSSRGGWELGSYLFIGNALQVAGLQTVPADRAAFLVQLTTVMVPLLSAFSAGKISAVSLKTWAACAIAFAGVVVMGADNDDSSNSGSESDSGAMLLNLANSGSNDGNNYSDKISYILHSISGGDVFIVFAALAYSMHVLRLGAYAPRTAPLRLAAAKAKAETVFSASVVLLLANIGGGGGGPNAFFLPKFIVKSGEDVSKYFSWLASDRNAFDLLVPSIGAILWTGWVTCAYTIYAQSFGQRRVNPTDANLIYATQPLFTSLFAYFLLGETLGPNGYVGAALIGTALLLVST